MMTIQEIRDSIFPIVKTFFQEATVVWAEQGITKPKLPYVTLKLGNVERELFPIGELDGSYSQSIKLEVNLYTKGLLLSNSKNEIASYMNTATSDFMDFVNYMDSDEITDRLSEYGITILFESPVQDLTSLENDVAYRYRAMGEFNIYFKQETAGRYNVRHENASGGGSPNFDFETYIIEDVDLRGGVNGEE